MPSVSLPASGRTAPALSKRILVLAGDDRLVQQIRRGSEAAFEVVFERHGAGVLSFCRHMLGSREEAEDAVQQTFASAYSDLLRDEREIRLKPWLYTIARNRCLSMLRARREILPEKHDVAVAGLHHEVERRAELRELLDDLARLPEEQRAALVLTELGDLSHAEVAGVLGCEAPKVKALVFRARSGLLERREARETPCSDVREQLANLRGGSLRRSGLRHHLSSCPGCRAYRDEVRRQRAAFGVLLPVVPSGGLKSAVLSAAGLGGGSGGGGLALGLTAAAGALPGGSATVAKVAVVGLLAGGGVVTGEIAVDRGGPAEVLAPPAASGKAVAPAGGLDGGTRRSADATPAATGERPGYPARGGRIGKQAPDARARDAGPRTAPGQPGSPGENGLGRDRRAPRAAETHTGRGAPEKPAQEPVSRGPAFEPGSRSEARAEDPVRVEAQAQAKGGTEELSAPELLVPDE